MTSSAIGNRRPWEESSVKSGETEDSSQEHGGLSISPAAKNGRGVFAGPPPSNATDELQSTSRSFWGQRRLSESKLCAIERASHPGRTLRVLHAEISLSWPTNTRKRTRSTQRCHVCNGVSRRLQLHSNIKEARTEGYESVRPTHTL